MFCHVIVKNYLCNILCKFFIKIKIESTWRREIKEQTPQLTLLLTVRSSHRRCSIKKLFLKISQYPQETPVLESDFKKVAGLKESFPVNIAKFLILPLLKNICAWIYFDCFNDSLLHGSKGLRSRLYDDVRHQGPSHRSSFLVFKSASLVLIRVLACVRKPKTNTFDESISFYIGYFWLF